MVRVVRAVSRLLRFALVAIVGYLGTLTVAAAYGSRRSRRPPPVRPQHRFAILVPAHDEAQVIAVTLASLDALDYPRELFSVHVVADNCTDRTVEIATAAGVDVHDRVDAQRPGKGPALQWLMGRLWDRGMRPDAVVFVDADTTVDPAFLRVVDAHLARGEHAVQGHYAVRDPEGSAVVAFRAAALAARTYLRPLGRATLGGSAGLYGNGMVLRRQLLESRQWSDHLTEDIELHLRLLMDGIKVAFAPGARVEAEMPHTLEASRTQHERWERGRVEMAARFVPILVRRTITGGPAGRIAYADAAFDQAVPPFSIVVAATGLWTVMGGLGALVPFRRRRLPVVPVGLLAVETVFVLSALGLSGAPAASYRALASAPRMVLWKVQLWLQVLIRRGGTTAWRRTRRNQPVEADTSQSACSG